MTIVGSKEQGIICVNNIGQKTTRNKKPQTTRNKKQQTNRKKKQQTTRNKKQQTTGNKKNRNIKQRATRNNKQQATRNNKQQDTRKRIKKQQATSNNKQQQASSNKQQETRDKQQATISNKKTTSNNKQQQATTSNTKHQQATTSNNQQQEDNKQQQATRRQQATTSNNKQHQATTSNKQQNQEEATKKEQEATILFVWMLGKSCAEFSHWKLSDSYVGRHTGGSKPLKGKAKKTSCSKEEGRWTWLVWILGIWLMIVITSNVTCVDFHMFSNIKRSCQPSPMQTGQRLKSKHFLFLLQNADWLPSSMQITTRSKQKLFISFAGCCFSLMKVSDGSSFSVDQLLSQTQKGRWEIYKNSATPNWKRMSLRLSASIWYDIFCNCKEHLNHSRTNFVYLPFGWFKLWRVIRAQPLATKIFFLSSCRARSRLWRSSKRFVLDQLFSHCSRTGEKQKARCLPKWTRNKPKHKHNPKQHTKEDTQ